MNSDHPIPGPSRAHVTVLSGTIPGLLDSTQPSRLLRYPGSKLSFASFDPTTASSELRNLQKLSLNEELYRPKRVVLETAPTGQISWRFVPTAKRDPSVSDEGPWPRLIEICGETVECYQDQWDIYKLDPLYKCYVRAAPDLTLVTRVSPTVPQASPSHTQGTDLGKRQLDSSPSPERNALPPRKKAFSQHPSVPVITDSEESDEELSIEGEEAEVEGMVVDNKSAVQTWSTFGRPSQQRRQMLERYRSGQRRKKKRRPEPLSRETTMEDQSVRSTPSTQTVMDEDYPSQSGPPSRLSEDAQDVKAKRKVNALFESLQIDPETSEDIQPTHTYTTTGSYKRARTLSPTSTQRSVEQRRRGRDKAKRGRREKGEFERQYSSLYNFMPTLHEEAAFFMNNSGHGAAPSTEHSIPTNDTPNGDTEEERAHQAAIEESRRKLAELEADRPLWEEARQRRLQQEAEDRRQAEAKKAEAERLARIKREQEEEARRAEQERRERERYQRQQRWAFGPWTTQRALERYKVLCEAFDSTKFGPEEPLESDMVPWPVLQAPARFSIEDVDWASVEKFFEAVEPHMRSQDYKIFVEKSHRRFHPDRWRSRSLLKSVIDEAERGCMEVAANTVAQALTPIWRSVAGG